jgi:hypothetical protein
LHHAPHSIPTRLQRKARIQPSNSVLEALLKHYFIVAIPLRSMAIGADVFLTLSAITQLLQLF